MGDPGFDLEEDGVKAKEGDDDEDVPAVLTRSVVIGEKLPFLPPDYSISEGRLAYNQDCGITIGFRGSSNFEGRISLFDLSGPGYRYFGAETEKNKAEESEDCY